MSVPTYVDEPVILLFTFPLGHKSRDIVNSTAQLCQRLTNSRWGSCSILCVVHCVHFFKVGCVLIALRTLDLTFEAMCTSIAPPCSEDVRLLCVGDSSQKLQLIVGIFRSFVVRHDEFRAIQLEILCVVGWQMKK